MWRPILNPLFFFMLLVYVGIHIGRMGRYTLPQFVNNYVTDLICMPVILSMCLVGVRIIKKRPSYKLNFIMIYGMTSFYAFYFEYYLPKNSLKYTADIWDVVMYFSGATFFLLTYQKAYHQSKDKLFYNQFR